jgi:hypothetical protein
MKKPKPRTKAVAAKKPAKGIERGAKAKQPAAAPRKASAARQPAGMDSLAEAVADLAAIAAELRQVTDDLRDLMSEPEEPEVGELIIAEVENPENLEEET